MFCVRSFQRMGSRAATPLPCSSVDAGVACPEPVEGTAFVPVSPAPNVRGYRWLAKDRKYARVIRIPCLAMGLVPGIIETTHETRHYSN